MRRIVIILAIASIAAGCSSAEAEAERRREIFRVPNYGNTYRQQPKLDNVGELLRQASPYYHGAVAEQDPYKKKRMFKEAARLYEQAVRELEALQKIERDARKREEMGFILMAVREDLADCYRQMPITGE